MTHPVRLKTHLIAIDANISVIVALGNSGEWLTSTLYIHEAQKVILRLISIDKAHENLIDF